MKIAKFAQRGRCKSQKHLARSVALAALPDCGRLYHCVYRYLWLLHHESPTKVGTYAYVNPVVAVLLGHFLGAETLGLRTILGTFLVLISVVVITTTRTKTDNEYSQRKKTGYAPLPPDLFELISQGSGW